MSTELAAAILSVVAGVIGLIAAVVSRRKEVHHYQAVVHRDEISTDGNPSLNPIEQDPGVKRPPTLLEVAYPSMMLGAPVGSLIGCVTAISAGAPDLQPALAVFGGVLGFMLGPLFGLMLIRTDSRVKVKPTMLEVVYPSMMIGVAVGFLLGCVTAISVGAPDLQLVLAIIGGVLGLPLGPLFGLLFVRTEETVS